MTRLCAVLLALGAAVRAEQAALVTMGTLPAGDTSLTASVGRPMMRARVDRGLTAWLDAGLAVDGATSKFLRPGLGARLRLLRRGCAGLTARGDLSVVKPLSTSYGPRPIMAAGDAELGLQADVGFGERCNLGISAQVSGLLDTDFSSTRTGVYLQSTGGVEWVPFGPFSLLAQGGELRGRRGARAVLGGGAAIRF